jgi:hypothetical protein
MCCLVSPRALTVALLQTARAELVRRYLDQTPTGAIRWATLRGRNHPIVWSIRPTRRCNRDIRSPPYAFQAKCVSGVKRFCVHGALQLTKSLRSVGNDFCRLHSLVVALLFAATAGAQRYSFRVYGTDHGLTNLAVKGLHPIRTGRDGLLLVVEYTRRSTLMPTR